MTVFVSAVDASNFSAAARILGITPSAVSKQISRLEARLGARLLNRSTRRISLTDVGREFYERSQSILSYIHAAERAGGDASDRPRGRLRITASISFGQRQIVPLVPEFVARFPDVRVDVLFSDQLIDMVDEGVDVAVRVSAPADSALIYSTVYSDTWRFNGPTGPRAVKVASNFSANSGEAIRDLALGGFGIARLATFLVGPDLKAGRLVQVMADRQDPQENVIHVVYPSRRLVPPATRAFVDFLAEKMTPVPPWEQ